MMLMLTERVIENDIWRNREVGHIQNGAGAETNALWISSTTGKAMTKKNLGTLISKITLETVGVDV